MIRTILIEEKERKRECIADLIREQFPQLVVIGEADGVVRGLNLIHRSSPDLILLGIQLKDGLGFSVLRAMKANACKTVIFAETKSYAFDALKFNVLDYIIEPVTKQKLTEALYRVSTKIIDDLDLRISDLNASLVSSKRRRLVLRTSDMIHLIPFHEIIRCEANRNYSDFYLSSGRKITVCSPLKEYEVVLNEHGFFRIHKSHIVNLDYVETYFRSDGGHVLMSEGSRLPVADRKKASLLQLFKSI